MAKQWKLFAEEAAAKAAVSERLEANPSANVAILYCETRRRKYRVAPGWMQKWRGEESLGVCGKLGGLGYVKPDWE